MTSSKSFVRFDKVDKSYDGKVLVVKDLNLDIDEGEFITMLGPSGSGKTTCLMMLAGFETPTNGEIYLDSNPISNIPPHKRGIGMVFQNYALFPHMTVYENLAFPLKVRKVTKEDIDKKVDKALSMVSLSGFENRMPGQLSGGQQQRVAVARALVFDPQVVLMDEPLGALDKNLRESMQYEIKHIHESIGVTVVYVTHDQGEALTMSNRIAVFNDGKVQQLSSPDKLYEEPVNSFVAEFIGENNTFSGQVTDISGGKCKVKLDSGSEIMSNPIRVNSKGEKTIVSLRPERAIINPENKMENINTAALTVLEKTGISEHFEELLDLVLPNGAFLNNHGRLCFPRSLMEDILANSAKEFYVYARGEREGKDDMHCTSKSVYFANSGTAVTTFDSKTKSYRPSTLRDIYDFTRLVDQLENIHMLGDTVLANDIEDDFTHDINTVYAILSGSQKPACITFRDRSHIPHAIRLFDFASGGEGSFMKKPSVIFGGCPIVSPLRIGRENMEILIMILNITMLTFFIHHSACQT